MSTTSLRPRQEAVARSGQIMCHVDITHEIKTRCNSLAEVCESPHLAGCHRPLRQEHPPSFPNLRAFIGLVGSIGVLRNAVTTRSSNRFRRCHKNYGSSTPAMLRRIDGRIAIWVKPTLYRRHRHADLGYLRPRFFDFAFRPEANASLNLTFQTSTTTGLGFPASIGPCGIKTNTDYYIF